jgi:glucose/mannose transport system permease protein
VITAILPAAIVIAVGFYGFVGWTVAISFTDSRLLPRYEWVGLRNYATIFHDERFWNTLAHLAMFGTLFIPLTLVLGVFLAIAIDQIGARKASALHTLFLYPVSISWLVTGLVWQWVLNPAMGLERTVQALGFHAFTFEALVHPETAMFALVGAAVWHAAGLVMVVFLAGLRGIDPDLWRAARVEGVSAAQTYRHVILPMLRPYFLTAILLLSFATLRMFDLVVAMTAGGPGFATDMPALYVYDYTFARGRLATGAASAVVLMLTASLALVPYLAIQLRRRK